MTRRTAIKGAASLAAAGLLAQSARAESGSEQPGRAAMNGRIKQSIVHWCFAQHWDIAETARIARELGCRSIELVSPEHWPLLKEQGLTCAIASVPIQPGPGFKRGFNNPAHRDRLVAATKQAIDDAAAFGCPSVIAFTGFKYRDPDDANSGEITLDEGLRNCVAGFKQVVGHAEQQGVTICLEMLNTRDDSHPMKGHPGYQGDRTEYCLDIIRQVGSPRLKLLFDIYHVQIMDGDVIRRIRQNHELIGHVHTAGNPGRGELDDDQEINYPAVMRALVEVGYDGYVGQEFIPTRDPLAGLRQAVAACDV